jgi:hypothetical protein
MDSEASNFVRKVIPSGHICTHTGRAVDPANFKADDVCLEDIAHALSMICRFNGHTKFHYSVAQHSVHGSLEFCASDIDVRHDPLLVSKWFLLHDAAEAYICDMPRPIKQHPEIRALFDRIEDSISAAIAERFNLPPMTTVLSSVATIDLRMLFTEKRDCLRNPTCSWHPWYENEPLPYNGHIHQITPEEAEMKFLTIAKILEIF